MKPIMAGKAATSIKAAKLWGRAIGSGTSIPLRAVGLLGGILLASHRERLKALMIWNRSSAPETRWQCRPRD
jgi:hypothetical protein